MRMQSVLRAAIVLVCLQSLVCADEFLLQLALTPETGDSDTAATQPAASPILEANVSLGRAFYVQTTGGKVRWLLRGKVEREAAGSLAVQYTLIRTDSANGAGLRTQQQGTISVELGRASPLVQSPAVRHSYTLTLHPFVPVIGYRESSSGFSVRLLDEESRPVADAAVTLYGPLGDSDWEPIVGPVRSNAEGIARISEGRESLGEWTLVAEHPQRGFQARVLLDRVQASAYLAPRPQDIVMRKPAESPSP